MRALGALGALLMAAAACGTGASPAASEASRYLGDEVHRREALVASLVNPSNAYSALRLAHYGGGDGLWESLPEWNPRVEPVTPDEVDRGQGTKVRVSSAAAPLELTASPDDEAAMRALGEAAFFRYPTQLAGYAKPAVASRAAAASYGAWVDEARGQVGGLVRAEMGDGGAALAVTCATCHSAAGDAGLVVGVGSDRLDLGRLMADAEGGGGAGDPRLGWGRGRVDVTTADASAPVRIPDVRPARWLTYLHQEATIAKHDRTTLAIRIETLLITAHGQTLRPPRVLAWALATYLESLADGLPSTPTPSSGPVARGAATFQARCAGCHGGTGMTGAPVPLEVVGTDPAIGRSSDRGTGMYRVPSLRGVGTRGLLLHDASLPGLDAMFDPARTGPSFAGGTRGAGAVPGHVFGLDLDDAARADLVGYLRTL